MKSKAKARKSERREKLVSDVTGEKELRAYAIIH